jgi:hypothetical protein
MKRTLKQNRALHKYLTELGNALNDAGWDMKTTLKPSVDIPWTPDMVKEYLWRPIQKIITDVESTTELETSDVDLIYKVLDRHIASKFGVSVHFPSDESMMAEQQV